MSGRELNFDQRVVLDLSRHLRRASSPEWADDPAERTAPPTGRPDTTFLIESVSRAAASISSKDAQIQSLQDKQHELDGVIDRMRTKLGELGRLHQAAEAKAKAEAERAQRGESMAARLQARVEDLEGDLELALSDLHRIADVITGSLLTSERR